MCIIYILGALFICLTIFPKAQRYLLNYYNDAFTGTVAGGSVGTVIICNIDALFNQKKLEQLAPHQLLMRL